MRMKIVSAFLILSFVLLAVPSFAIGKPNALTGRPSGLPTRAQNRLAEAKLRSCQARENAITKRMTRLIALVTTMESKFDAITQRVEDYYTSKVVPSGKTVADYDALVTGIQTKKSDVQTALTSAQTNADDFSCTSDDPKGLLIQFREDMQAVKGALKDYRTAIKNLIVAVHSVTGATESASPSVSPEPTE
jgi:hypothetical protein